MIDNKTQEDHLQDITSVFEHLNTVKPSICTFVSTSCNYLGHFLGNVELKPDPTELSAVRN